MHKCIKVVEKGDKTYHNFEQRNLEIGESVVVKKILNKGERGNYQSTLFDVEVEGQPCSWWLNNYLVARVASVANGDEFTVTRMPEAKSKFGPYTPYNIIKGDITPKPASTLKLALPGAAKVEEKNEYTADEQNCINYITNNAQLQGFKGIELQAVIQENAEALGKEHNLTLTEAKVEVFCKEAEKLRSVGK